MRKILLELTEDQARTLYVVTGIFNGSPSNSPRKHTEAIYNRLSRYFSERSYIMAERELLPSSCELMFDDYPITKTLTEPVKNDLSHLKISIDTSSEKKDIEELTELLKQVEAIKNRIFKGE